MKVHALTIDLEDWHQLVHRRVTGQLIPPTRAVVEDTRRLLDLLDEAGVRGTFFVLGHVADAYPDLVREVVRRGHEVGSHTHSHELVWGMDPDAFRADVERSVKRLEDLTGAPVHGFRAPEFSVGALDHWCFAILAELGFRYDSSVFPLRGARYGIPKAPRRPFPIDTPAGRLWEFPLATWDVGPVRLPVAGGTYFRVLPGVLLRRALRDLQEADVGTVLYFHPYEFHRGWLRLAGLPWRTRLRPANIRMGILHNFCTSRITRRLQDLSRRFSFVPLREIYSHVHTSNGSGPSAL